MVKAEPGGFLCRGVFVLKSSLALVLDLSLALAAAAQASWR